MKWLWALLLVGCAPAQVERATPLAQVVQTATPSASPSPAVVVETRNYDVVNRFPHETTAFTQGLLCDRPGHLWESTGQYGQSRLSEIDLASGRVKVHHRLGKKEFGEGLALLKGRFFWLTWQNGICHTFDDKLQEGEEFRYQGEGWGLCPDDQGLLWMSNGSPELVLRDPKDFAIKRRLEVRAGGKPLPNLNELEWVEGKIYANLWGSSQVAVIDPQSGQVDSFIDFSGLLSPEEAQAADVLNGIAYCSKTRQLWVTGKYWPKLFEVKVR